MKNMRLEEMDCVEWVKGWIRWNELKSTVVRLEDVKFPEELERQKCLCKKYKPGGKIRIIAYLKVKKDCRNPNSEKDIIFCIEAKFPFCSECEEVRNRERKMRALYSITESKFILPFEEYGFLNIQSPFVVAYCNKKMGAFTYGGEPIIPMTSNIAVGFVSKHSSLQVHYYYLKITKLPEDWFEKGKKETILLKNKDILDQREEYEVLNAYLEKYSGPVGVYSVLQNKLIVPIKYANVQVNEQRENQPIDGKVHFITDDGLFSHGVYSQEGRCLIETGRYGDIYATKKYIVARKHMHVRGYDDYYTTNEVLGPNCGQVSTYYVWHKGGTTCMSCVDLYSHEGRLLKENVFISSGDFDSLKWSCYESKIDQMEIKKNT